MSLSRISFILFLLPITQIVFAQNGIDNLHYRNRISKASVYMNDSMNLHSGVLPLINLGAQNKYFVKTPGQLTIDYPNTFFGDAQWGCRFYPIADIVAGIESGRPGSAVRYTAGAGLGMDYTRKKLFITGKLMPYLTESDYVGDSIRQLFQMDLGTTRPILGSLFQRSEFLIAYRPHQIFTFLGGYGKNFFGEGYRSLLLSDNASNYPFLKIETAFGGIKYVNLYTVWNENSLNPSDKSFDRMKFSALHYLSWNITKQFNLSIFESVVWQAKDTLAKRGYDLNYLNPVVFYRPVEYSSGSADNVLLGLNLSYKLDGRHVFYSQVIIDEFLLSQIKSDQKWWGNKWGFQLGYKSNHFFNKKIYFQTEFNVVRPFTYSHKYPVQNYGHLNASVTHPIGANFYEVLQLFSYSLHDIRFTNKMTFSAYGTNSDSVNQGQNIFDSYSDRNGDFGHLIMQGLRTNVFNEQLILEKPIFEKIDLYLTATYNYRMQWTATSVTHNHFVFIGLKSRIWNSYSDY